MNVLLITYDLRQPGRNYAPVHEAIKAIGAWAKPLESVWLVKTTSSAESVAATLRTKIDKNDWLLVIHAQRPAAGWLTDEMWKWINANVP